VLTHLILGKKVCKTYQSTLLELICFCTIYSIWRSFDVEKIYRILCAFTLGHCSSRTTHICC